MDDRITASVATRLMEISSTPRVLDLYEADGATLYQELVGADRSEIREILALARAVDGPILDLAAGSGRITIPLVRLGARVTAVDLSSDMLRILRQSLPDAPHLECIHDDIRTLSLPQTYPLIVLGATSITLLDTIGRADLYRTVRRHLRPAGQFALTVAGDEAGTALRVTEDRILSVGTPPHTDEYLYAQEFAADASSRLVNWVRIADLIPGVTVPIYTSLLRTLDPDTVCTELVAAGFTEPRRSAVRSAVGTDILLLETSVAGGHR